MSSPFDEARYQALLEGLEVSVVKLSDIRLEDRIDSEYFLKDSLRIELLLKEKKSLEFRSYGDFVASAFYPAATHLYEVGDTPFIRCVDCINYPLITDMQNESFEKIPIKFVQQQSGINTLLNGDLVITKVGSPCYASIVMDHQLVALSRTVLGLKNITNINTFYLLTFLRSKYGFNQLLRQRELTIQYQLTLDRVKSILIFKPSSDFQIKIENKVKEYYQSLRSAQYAYSAAERLLLEALGLADFQPSREKVNVKSFQESFLASGRLDAEFYQVKYEELEYICKSNAVYVKSIHQIQSYNARGLQPEYAEDGTLDVINSRHILERDLDYDNFEKTQLKSWDMQEKARVYRGDILIYTTGANIGRTQVYMRDTKALASNHVNILRIAGEDPAYVAFVLNSLVGRLQTEQLSAGSAQQELYPKDIANFYIPFVDPAIQATIIQQTQEAARLRSESSRLLDLAKRAVEVAIEEGEDVGMRVLEG